MTRILNSSTALLWLLVIGTAILLGGQAAGMQWSFSPKMSFGRLLVHPWVAAIEVLFATVLIVLAGANHPKKKWVTIGIAALAVACAAYHMFYYLIGMEFLLMYGAVSLIRESSKQA